MKKFKKAMALSLALAMGLSLVACGDKKDDKKEDNKDTEATTTAAPGNTDGDSDTTAAPEGDGDDTTAAPSGDAAAIEAPSTDGWDSSKKIYAYSWDDDFQKKLNIVLEAHPEYKDYVEGKNLGLPGTDGQYQDAIDAALENADEYPSLIPSDNSITKYFAEDDTKTLNLYDIGFSKEVLANSYDFAIQFGTYGDQLKSVTWQACPGSVFYNRAIAKEVFGTDDPAEIQKKIGTWDDFFKAADELKAKNYKIVAGDAEIEYAVLDGKTTAWVQIADDGSESLKLDETINQFLELSKKLYDGGYTNHNDRWGEDGGWAKSMGDGQDVFCYFGCPWFIGSMKDSGAVDGSWAACVGPQAYHWGGTYVCVGKDTPNPELCAYLLYEMTCNPDIAVEITNKTGDCCNNKAANDRLVNGGELAADNAGLAFLGGQNPFEIWAAAAEGLNLSAVTYADGTIQGFVDDANKAYNSGEMASMDEAISYIKTQCESKLGLTE